MVGVIVPISALPGDLHQSWGIPAFPAHKRCVDTELFRLTKDERRLGIVSRKKDDVRMAASNFCELCPEIGIAAAV